MIRILMFRPKEKFKQLNIENVHIENVPITEILFNKIKIDDFIKNKFDYVIFTSSIAVNSFKTQFPDYENFLKGSEIVAIGYKTAEALGLDCKVPDLQSSNGIVGIIKGNSSVLLVRSENGNPYLVKKLEQKTKKLVVINAYRSNIINENFIEIFNALRNNEFDAAIFTSSMIFNTYIKIFSQYGNPLEILPRILVAIGDETAKSMKKFNLNPVVMDKPDVEKSVEKIVSLIKRY